MNEQTEYWETIKILRAEDHPISGQQPHRPGRIPRPFAQITFQVIESNKQYRIGNVHTVNVFGESITRALAAHAMGVRLIAHSNDTRTALYPIEHPATEVQS